MDGAGRFTDAAYGLEDWYKVSEGSYESIVMATNSEGETYLEMTKTETASGFFDDGLAFLFKDE